MTRAPGTGRGRRPTTLLVIGDTRYTVEDGRWHTLVALSKQLDVWFAEFDRVVIAAHLQPGAPPPDHRCLDHQNIDFVPLRSAGGTGLRAKADVGLALLSWVRVLVPLMGRATAVHLRTPCNVTIAAIPLARVLSRNRYAIYADNWEPLGVEPVSYRIQRWMLRHFKGVVHAYAPPNEDLPAHIRPNVSPSFAESELEALIPDVTRRVDQLRADPAARRPLRICSVASFSVRKNQSAIIRAAAVLKQRGIPVQLRFAGSGATQAAARSLVADLGLGAEVEFLGQIGRDAVIALFAWADVNVLVGFAEGFGKVFLEGMALGCPAVCGPGRMQRAIIGAGARGRQADPSDPTDIADALEDLRNLPIDRQVEMVLACRAYVAGFTTEAFAHDIQDIIRRVWALPPPDPAGDLRR